MRLACWVTGGLLQPGAVVKVMSYTIVIDQHTVQVDKCDAHLLDAHSWFVRTSGCVEYVKRWEKISGKSRTIYLHREILGDACAGLIVDHINGDRMDNRRCNLRVVDKCGNNQNVRKARVTSKSGLLGANWHKRTKAWRAQIRLKGATIHIGYFNTAEAAHAAYIEKKRQLHATCSI